MSLCFLVIILVPHILRGRASERERRRKGKGGTTTRTGEFDRLLTCVDTKICIGPKRQKNPNLPTFSTEQSTTSPLIGFMTNAW